MMAGLLLCLVPLPKHMRIFRIPNQSNQHGRRLAR